MGTQAMPSTSLRPGRDNNQTKEDALAALYTEEMVLAWEFRAEMSLFDIRTASECARRTVASGFESSIDGR
jgi:hypothetical protein